MGFDNYELLTLNISNILSFSLCEHVHARDQAADEVDVVAVLGLEANGDELDGDELDGHDLREDLQTLPVE